MSNLKKKVKENLNCDNESFWDSCIDYNIVLNGEFVTFRAEIDRDNPNNLIMLKIDNNSDYVRFEKLENGNCKYDYDSMIVAVINEFDIDENTKIG